MSVKQPILKPWVTVMRESPGHPGAVFAVDPNHIHARRPVFVNAGFCSLYGRTERELLAVRDMSRWRRVFANEQDAQLMRERLVRGHPYRGAVVVMRPGGRRLLADVLAVTVRGSGAYYLASFETPMGGVTAESIRLSENMLAALANSIAGNN